MWTLPPCILCVCFPLIFRPGGFIWSWFVADWLGSQCHTQYTIDITLTADSLIVLLKRVAVNGWWQLEIFSLAPSSCSEFGVAQPPAWRPVTLSN